MFKSKRSHFSQILYEFQACMMVLNRNFVEQKKKTVKKWHFNVFFVVFRMDEQIWISERKNQPSICSFENVTWRRQSILKISHLDRTVIPQAHFKQIFKPYAPSVKVLAQFLHLTHALPSQFICDRDFFNALAFFLLVAQSLCSYFHQ